jgi:hypothetical protein
MYDRAAGRLLENMQQHAAVFRLQIRQMYVIWSEKQLNKFVVLYIVIHSASWDFFKCSVCTMLISIIIYTREGQRRQIGRFDLHVHIWLYAFQDAIRLAASNIYG